VALAWSVINGLVTGFHNDLARARSLYETIALNGARRNGDGYSPLRQPDRRDAAQFIFFEIAAQFEHFCLEAFQIEVRYHFKVQPQRARHLMGSADRGLAGVMGWGAPKQLQSRARNLYGKNGFFARLETHLGEQTYLKLVNAHKIRNRVAHNGGNAVKDFNAILAQLQVPQPSRKGLSVGRLLMDYPTAAPQTDRWFFRLIAAYKALADTFLAYFRPLVPATP